MNSFTMKTHILPEALCVKNVLKISTNNNERNTFRHFYMSGQLWNGEKHRKKKFKEMTCSATDHFYSPLLKSNLRIQILLPPWDIADSLKQTTWFFLPSSFCCYQLYWFFGPLPLRNIGKQRLPKIVPDARLGISSRIIHIAAIPVFRNWPRPPEKKLKVSRQIIEFKFAIFQRLLWQRKTLLVIGWVLSFFHGFLTVLYRLNEYFFKSNRKIFVAKILVSLYCS